jgi:acyl-CoA hydrolase
LQLAYRSMDPRPAAASQVTLVEWMGVDDSNATGNVHGGTVMKLCDEAAGIAAIKHSRCRVVTAAMDRMAFLLPVHVGELLTLKASVNAVWRTSMEIGVRVEAEDMITGRRRHTNSCYLTFVAVDRNGRPMAIPQVVPETPEEERRYAAAKERRRRRLEERNEEGK